MKQPLNIELHAYSLQLYKSYFTSGRGYQNIAEIFSYLEIDEHCRLELKIVIYLKVTIKTIKK